MENANLWTRRSNSSKLSLSMKDTDGKDNNKTDSPRGYTSRKFGDTSSHGGKSNPFNAVSPSVAKSPATGASSAFGLGTGAFASFGSIKTPKTPGTGAGFDFTSRDKKDKDLTQESIADKTDTETASNSSKEHSSSGEHPLKSTWTLFYRPPTNKYSDYEKSTIKLASLSTAESFWTIYSHLKRPSLLPSVSDYHIFKEGIRPVWEDEANKRGGKWIIRLKKGVADRYWEDLLLIIIGDQFLEAGEEVCGAVLSVRSGEDVLSIWTKNNGGRNIKIRETIKRALDFPADTNMVWKSHDDSIAQRSAIDEARHQKSVNPLGEKRRQTINEDSERAERKLLRHFSNSMRATSDSARQHETLEARNRYAYLHFRKDDALMNLLGTFGNYFKSRHTDAAPIDLTNVKQTNVPSRPRPRGSMPSTRSEVTTSAKPALPSRKSISKNGTKGFLNQYDHVQQDPIEVSDGEDDTKPQPKRSSRPQLTTPSTSQPAHSSTKRIDLNRRADEGRLLGDYGKKPADAFPIPIPTGPNEESIMPKHKFHTGLRVVNTLDRSAKPASGSKQNFYGTHTSSGRKPPTDIITNYSKRKPAGLPKQMEPPNKKPRTNDESPDILHSNGSGHGSKSTKLKLQSVNNSVHDLSSSPASAPERWDDLFSNDLHAGQDDTRVVIPPKKLQSPWDTPDHSLTYVERFTSHAEMVMSDDEDSFTKDAAKQRRCEADYYGEDVEIRQSRKVNSARKMPTSTSTIYAQEYARSPSRRRRELDKIIPDSLLRAQPDDHSSPDVIQDAIAFDKESNPSRHVRAIKGIASSANVAPNTSMRTSGDYENPGHVKLYRTKQMLFGSALDVSGYVLAVDRSTHSFSIDYDSTLLNQDSIVSNIRVDRIHKVIHGEKGPKVKITTANIPGIGHEILLELTSHKLVCELSLLLQNLGHGISSETESDDRLDKMFLRASTNAKKHTAAKCKVVARTDETATVSPYFGSTTEHNGTDRVLRRNGTHKREYSSLDSPGGFDHPPAPRERRSPAARGRTELQEDYKERDASAKLNRESTLTEASASRSRNTRLTSTFRSPPPPPPPPLKYSQTGKLGQSWEKPLRYPINGKKKATVEFDDLSRLDDEEFLNDNLIAFFLRYLEHHLEQEQPDLFKRSYFFNSYFYEKLRQKPPDKKSVINYVGVKKWTDKISLFNRDFIVVPVNENLHWYLAIICNLSWFKLSEAEQDALEEAEIRENALVAERELATENAQDTQKSLQELSLEDRELHGEILVSDLAPESSGKSSASAKKKGKKRKSEPQLKRVSSYKPAIITLDSLGMPRYSTVSALKHYIAQEASARLDKEIDMADIHGIAAKKIPLQSNYSDCGLFVCAYLERFVVDPTAFVKQELGRIPQQWPKMHSHDLRSMMRDFIVDLHKSGEGGVSEKPIPSVGEILLPPVTSPRPAVNGRLEDEGIEDSTFYDPPTSPIVSRGRRAREDEQREAQEHDSGAEENDINSGGGNGPQHFDDGSILNSNGHASGDALGSSSGNSLRARTAKLLSSPIIRHSNIVPESDSEPEMISPPRAIDHPSAMAKGMREERSLKALRKIRSTSSNLTDFLEGHESYQDHGTGADDDHEMLLE